MSNELSRNLELRKVPVGTLSHIAMILEIDNDWKKVMALVPRDPRSKHFHPKYTNDHIRQIEGHARASDRKCADVLFEEWGTSGRIRPTLGTLKEVVLKAKIYRAADELSRLIQEENPKRPEEGPAAFIPTDITSLKQITRNASNSLIPDFSAILNSKGINSSILNDEQIIFFEYKDLEKITKQFSAKFECIPDEDGNMKMSGFVGKGGFGEVYVGYYPKYKKHLAVKRIRDKKYNQLGSPTEIFNAEVKFSQFRHINIVCLIGISIDGPSLCMVSEYVDRGTLEQNIAQKTLTENQRIDIMVGIAEGIKFLHAAEIEENCEGKDNKNSGKYKVVHGDIKSANILLTNDLVPKLCDFGLAKSYDHTKTQNLPIAGTAPYMPNEMMRGTITQKTDIYSYGVVLLELLTGKKAAIKLNGGKISLVDYVDKKDISTILEVVVEWTKHKELFDLAKQCLQDMGKRPTAENMCNTLHSIKKNERNSGFKIST